MPDFLTVLQNGASGWLFFPAALLLGALHGLEPGHSKSIMAALIIAIRGTAWQAALLGISAAISHSATIWILAGLGIYFGKGFRAEETEPYFQIISAAFILWFAGWTFLRTRRSLAHAAEHEAATSNGGAFQDEHEKAHVRKIEASFANRQVTTPQIVMFGLTGGAHALPGRAHRSFDLPSVGPPLPGVRPCRRV